MRDTKHIAAAAAVVVATAGAALADDRPRHVVPPSADGDLVVALCDGTTTVDVKGKKPGDALSRGEAQAVADELMAKWKAKNPRARWDDAPRLAQNDRGAKREPSPSTGPNAGHGQASSPGQRIPAPASSATVARGAAAAPSNLQVGDTYGSYTTRDEQIWMASTEAFVKRGDAIFHDANALGGTISVSCDMCHPNAANTHPETYPKYQVQLGKVALLRDMINWCIENPVRGKPLPDDDPRLKAIEAYILAQRKGVPLAYGKH